MAGKGKLALVVRVSDVKGRDKKGDRFISPELQIAGGSGYARGRGFEEFEVFEDLNVSHTTSLDDRPGMSSALVLPAVNTRTILLKEGRPRRRNGSL